MERKNPPKKKTTNKERRPAAEKRHPQYPDFVKEGRMWVYAPATPVSVQPDVKELHRLDRMCQKMADK